MPLVFRRLYHAACCTLLLAAAPILKAQMQPRVRYEGKLLPIVIYSDSTYYVQHEGRKRASYSTNMDVQPASDFGPGFVRVTDVKIDLDPLKDASPKDRAKPSSIRFRFEADLTAETDLKDCYAVLTLVANGSVGLHPISVGRLSAGRTKHIEVELMSRVDAIGRIHVFSNAMEIRSTQVPDAYDAHDYHASLLQGSKGVSAVELCRPENRSPFAVANDGNRLATTRERETHNSLIVYDLAAMQLLKDIEIGKKGEDAWDLTWISDHELAYLTEDPRADRYFSNLMLLDLDSGKIELLMENVDRISARPKNQPDILVLIRGRWGPTTTKYDLRKRRIVGTNEFEEGWTIVDDNGDERVRWQINGDAYHYLYKPTPQSNWRALDKDVKQAGLKFDFRARDQLEKLCEIHSIGPDGDTLFVSTRLDSDHFKLAAYSMARGEIVRIVAENPAFDLRTGSDGFARLLFRKDSSELIGLRYDAEKARTVWFDEGFASVQRSMDRTFPDNVNVPVDWSLSGNTFIYHSYSDRDPGTYYVFRPFESRLIPVLVLGEALKDQRLGRTESWDFAARDGATIHAYVTRPPEPAAGPAPLVVNIHGGPTARDSWGFDETNQFLATRGYVVLQVNYRGSSGYGSDYQKAGLYARLDTVVLDDIADGVRQLIADGTADPNRIAVMGASFGGWATYMSLIKYPDLYRAGIAIAAVANWRKSIKDARNRFDNQVAFRFWKSLLDREDFDLVEPFIDPFLRAKELKQPIYIIHGERDEVVHPTEARLMLNELKKTIRTSNRRASPARPIATGPTPRESRC